MKKILAFLITSSCLLSLAGCPSPSTSNPSSSANPSSSNNPDINPSSISSGDITKATFIAYLTCIKTKVPEVTPAIDVHIANINNMSNAQWASSMSVYQAITQAYSSTGCKL